VNLCVTLSMSSRDAGNSLVPSWLARLLAFEQSQVDECADSMVVDALVFRNVMKSFSDIFESVCFTTVSATATGNSPSVSA